MRCAPLRRGSGRADGAGVGAASLGPPEVGVGIGQVNVSESCNEQCHGKNLLQLWA